VGNTFNYFKKNGGMVLSYYQSITLLTTLSRPLAICVLSVWRGVVLHSTNVIYMSELQVQRLEKCCYGLLTARRLRLSTRAILLGAAPDHLLSCWPKQYVAISNDATAIFFSNINTQDCSWY
jgi:hypothetical protein